MSHSRLVKAVFWVTASIMLTAAAIPRPSQIGSSRTILLSPHIRLGQSFTWIDHHTSWMAPPSGNGTTQPPVIDTQVVTCTALKQEGDGFVMSRRVKMMFGTPAGKPKLEPKPSMIERHAVEFTTESKPLNDKPVCLFYSVPMYGVPPDRLTVGASWHFDRSSFPHGSKADVGTTTVNSIDSEKGMIGLRVLWLGSVTDMVVGDGGVIESEAHSIISDPSKAPNAHPTLNEIEVWTLQHS
jgi:hypothetical protein